MIFTNKKDSYSILNWRCYFLSVIKKSATQSLSEKSDLLKINYREFLKECDVGKSRFAADGLAALNPAE